jgi:hypothetical protein
MVEQTSVHRLNLEYVHSLDFGPCHTEELHFSCTTEVLVSLANSGLTLTPSVPLVSPTLLVGKYTTGTSAFDEGCRVIRQPFGTVVDELMPRTEM